MCLYKRWVDRQCTTYFATTDWELFHRLLQYQEKERVFLTREGETGHACPSETHTIQRRQGEAQAIQRNFRVSSLLCVKD